MAETRTTSSDAERAARALMAAMSDHDGDLTIADAAARSGLPLRAAEVGLHQLIATYRGHLRATSEGELVFRFPHGFTRPWIVPRTLARVFGAVASGFATAGRFFVRAWITIVLVGYTLVFVALLIALLFGTRGRGRVGLNLFSVIARALGDAFFWTARPFAHASYVIAAEQDRVTPARTRVKAADETPFYEKVNRFFFGPEEPAPDERALERTVIVAIREGKGRIGLADVMRVTGLPRAGADALLSKLLIEHDGDVEAVDPGAVVYRFPALRKTVQKKKKNKRVPAAWKALKALPPLTGNSGAFNFAMVLLNGFNLLMSGWALAVGATIYRIALVLGLVRVGAEWQAVPWEKLPEDGVPWALGVVPFVFSVALFALPIARALLRPLRERRLARESGRLAMLREVLAQPGGVTGETLQDAYRDAAGRDIGERELTQRIVELGGDAEVSEQGAVRYRFPDLEAEAKALEAEREAAGEEEASVGEVVFASDQ